MAESDHSRSNEGEGCALSLYGFIGKISGIVVYFWFAVDLLMKGDLCAFLGWICLVGPIASFFVGEMWPFFLIYWLRESGRL